MCKVNGQDQGAVFGAWFKESRELAGLSRQKVAEKAKLPVEEIVLIEEHGAGAKLGRNTLTRLTLLLRLPE